MQQLLNLNIIIKYVVKDKTFEKKELKMDSIITGTFFYLRL